MRRGKCIVVEKINLRNNRVEAIDSLGKDMKIIIDKIMNEFFVVVECQVKLTRFFHLNQLLISLKNFSVYSEVSSLVRSLHARSYFSNSG